MAEKGDLRAPGGLFARLSCSCLCPCLQSKNKELKKEVTPRDLSSYSTSTSVEGISLGGFTSASSFGLLPGVSSQGWPNGNGAMVFTMAQLSKATSNFSPTNKIGQGGFSVVYKGKLPDGTPVAVKRARKDTFEARLTVEFQTEVNMLANVDHLNLVKLIGYLEEGNDRILVEEFVPNGNLRQHLDCQFGVVLDISTRLDIAIDVAHALTYLHVYADQPIIHRDVKSSNILLTENFRAKVADFGFSRMGPLDSDETHVSTQVKGTVGYLDPEYLKSYQLTLKSDVYSFGILLIEILTGRRPIEQGRVIEERITVRWAFRKFLDGNVADLMDPKLEKTPASQMVVERTSELAFQCSAPTRQDRPTMKKAQEHLWKIRKDYQAFLSGQ